ncbi:MAG: glycosyltransferase [Spirochaetia bacterium]|nr:MAG: glycosyltransferase [Spirochaetia bacterium]
MKICLYLEFYNFLGGIFYKNIGTGLLSSYENQKKTLKSLGVKFTEKWDDSCDILQINTPWLKSLWLIKKARKLNKKVIIWSHVTAEDARDVFWFNKYFFPLIKKYIAYAYGLADLVFCPSEHTKSLLVAYGLPAEKLIVQSNGVDMDFIYPDARKRAEYRQKYDCQGFTIGTVGLVLPRKGIDTFLAMAEKFPKNKFVWFGKIYSALMVESLPKNLPVNVKFTGYVEDSNAAFNALDAFIFPSYEENQGMVILEAAAIGLPIIVRDIPTYNPWLKDGVNCLKAKNNNEFKTCLENIIKDKKLREKLSKGALKLAENEDIKTQSKKLLETYQKLLGK